MAGYPGPGDISAAYGGLWESHHCLTGQSPGLAAHYPDILAGFTPDLGEIIIYFSVTYIHSILVNIIRQKLQYNKQKCYFF